MGTARAARGGIPARAAETREQLHRPRASGVAAMSSLAVRHAGQRLEFQLEGDLDHLGDEAGLTTKRAPASALARTWSAVSTVPTPTVRPADAASATAASAPGVSIVISTTSMPPP